MSAVNCKYISPFHGFAIYCPITTIFTNKQNVFWHKKRPVFSFITTANLERQPNYLCLIVWLILSVMTLDLSYECNSRTNDAQLFKRAKPVNTLSPYRLINGHSVVDTSWRGTERCKMLINIDYKKCFMGVTCHGGSLMQTLHVLFLNFQLC